MRHRTAGSAGLVLAIAGALGMAACGGTTGSPTPTSGPGGATPSPSEAGSSTGPTTPSSGPQQYTCDEPFSSPSKAASGNAHLVDVKVVSVPGHDELRFSFDAQALPALSMEQVSPPFTQDPSGLPLHIVGSAYLRLRFTPSSMVDDHGTPTYAGQVDFNVNGPSVKQLRLQGASEGVTTWLAGIGGPLCYQVWFEDSSTVAVWLQHPS